MSIARRFVWSVALVIALTGPNSYAGKGSWCRSAVKTVGAMVLGGLIVYRLAPRIEDPVIQLSTPVPSVETLMDRGNAVVPRFEAFSIRDGYIENAAGIKLSSRDGHRLAPARRPPRTCSACRLLIASRNAARTSP